jgi:type IV secretory pathway VirB3-like protein
MRQQVLKALANPPRIFYVPYSLAIMNFALQFVIFVVIFSISLIIGGLTGSASGINPLYFLISVIIVHMILVGFSKTEPQLAQIISAKINIFKSKIPNNINA